MPARFAVALGRFARGSAAALAAVLLLSGGVARAAILDVDTTTDDPTLNACTGAAGDCSLRGAIATANGNSEDDTINLPAGVYTLDTATYGQLLITSNIDIEGVGSGDCSGSGTSCIQASAISPGNMGEASSRVLEVQSGVFSISNVQMRYGFESSDPGGCVLIDAGATATLTGCGVVDNEAIIGAGIANAGTANLAQTEVADNGNPSIGPFSACGGVWNTGTMTITGGAIHENSAAAGGGICNFPLQSTDAMLTLSGSEVYGNFAFLGGGVWNDVGAWFLFLQLQLVQVQIPITELGNAVLTVNDMTEIFENLGIFSGGGVLNTRVDPAFYGGFNQQNVTQGPPNLFGQASADISDSAIGGNFSALGGGVLNDGFFVPLLLFSQLNCADSFPAPAGQCFLLPVFPPDPAAVTMTMENSILVENGAIYGGGLGNVDATAMLSLTEVFLNQTSSNFTFGPGDTFGGPTAGDNNPVAGNFLFDNGGGGLYDALLGNLSADQSWIHDNDAGEGGGVLNDGLGDGLMQVLGFLFVGDTSPDSIASAGDTMGTFVTLTKSTVSGNTALAGAGYLNFNGSSTLVNDTLSGNVAQSDGGGVLNGPTGLVDMSFVTVTNNTAGANNSFGDGGGIADFSAAPCTTNLKSTILAGNFDLAPMPTDPDCSNQGNIVSFGYNLVGDPTGCDTVFPQMGDQVGTSGSPLDPLLAALGNYGGPTETHALLFGSTAIDGVASGQCTDIDGNTVTEDQRSVTRPQIVSCDIGAYEANCGDGIINSPDEACDDGNNNNGDGCSSTCTIEEGFTCDNTQQPSACDGICGDGMVVAGEQCDEGANNCPDVNGCATSCCSFNCQFANGGSECRPSAGDCDVAESCSGQSGTCPSDAFVAATTECRPSGGACDPAESCTGTAPNCPPDAKEPAGFVCRASAGPCDVAETCNGSGDTCPPDAVAGSGTICRAAVNDCDVAETCDGSTVTCPSNSLQPPGTACGDHSSSECDDPDTCNGSGVCLPNHKPNGAICTPNSPFTYQCAGVAPTCESGVCTLDGGDPDNDGICTLRDNCPNDFNPDQRDANHNGIGDACERSAPVASPLGLAGLSLLLIGVGFWWMRRRAGA